MPRRRQRYSNLLAKLRDEGGSAPSPGDDDEGRVYNFYKFLLGASSNKITQTNKMPDEGRKRFKVGLYPFAVTPATTDATSRYIGYISAYSLLGLKTRVSGTEAMFGHNPSDEGGEVNDAYYPALFKVSYSKSGAATIDNKTSAITKDTYKYVPKRTFSIPFGRATTSITDSQTGAAETQISNVDELDSLKSITEEVKKGTGDSAPLGISYDPEVFKNPASSEKDTTATLQNSAIGTFDVG